jgi:tRNA-intron endonuclease
MGFRSFLAAHEDAVAPFLVYADLRERGFYLSPARWRGADDCDLVVFPRGSGPWDDAVAYRVRVVGERAAVPASALGDVVLAVVDEESELTYMATSRPDLAGRSRSTVEATVPADLLGDRVLAWTPPPALHEEAFYGQPLDAPEPALQLSLVEAAALAADGVLALDAAGIRERGRAVEGDRFDRRLAVYRALRDRGIVPKTGFKFGADFRTYADVEHVDDLGHSELLVRVLPDDHVFSPRDLALDVRLAHGVRKRMVFAATDGDGVAWTAVERLTP